MMKKSCISKGRTGIKKILITEVSWCLVPLSKYFWTHLRHRNMRGDRGCSVSWYGIARYLESEPYKANYTFFQFSEVTIFWLFLKGAQRNILRISIFSGNLELYLYNYTMKIISDVCLYFQFCFVNLFSAIRILMWGKDPN